MTDADLHLHTRFSDGDWTPSGLAQEAARLGLATIAVTDHDTLDGVAECLAAGRHWGVEVIAGVEYTCRLQRTEVHLLGYFAGDDRKSLELRAALECSRRTRRERVEQFVARLNKLGVLLTVDDVLEAGRGAGVLGRVHVALALQKRGVVKTIDEAFHRFLQHGRPAFVDRPRPELAEAIGQIERAGGVPVLAHPGLLKRDNQIEDMVSLGLQGLEVWHPKHSPTQTERYWRMTREYGLLATGGSDSHGRDERLFGSIRVANEHVVALRERAITVGKRSTT